MRELKRKSTARCDLSLYSNYLLLTPCNKGCTKLSKAMQTFSHDSVLNFLKREGYTSADLFNEVKQYLVLEGGTLSVDDSILDKPYSKIGKTDLVTRHYSGKHHGIVQGICLVSLFYTDINGVRFPVNYRIYLPAEEKSKNELFREMIVETLAWGLAPKVVTGDSWYASLDNLKLLRKKQLDAMFAIETDRLISTIDKKYERVGEATISQEGLFTHLKNFDWVTLFRIEQAGQKRHYIYYRYCDKNKQTPSIKEQVVSRENFEKIHKNHWHIEEYHRAIKQICNIEHFLVRKAKAIKNHIFSALWAFIGLEIKVIQNSIKNWYQWKETIEINMIRRNLT